MKFKLQKKIVLLSILSLGLLLGIYISFLKDIPEKISPAPPRSEPTIPLTSIEDNIINICYLGEIGQSLAFQAESTSCRFVSEKKLEELEKLDLSSMGLTSIPWNAFEKLKSLKVLNLSENELTVLKLPLLEKLEELNLSFNKISELKDKMFYFCPALKGLNLEGNPIQEIVDQPFYGLQNLESLNFLSSYSGSGEVSENTFMGLGALKKLSLDKEVTPPGDIFKHTPQLEELDWNEAPLEFHKLPLLHTLDFHIDQDEILPDEIFKNNTDLKKLSIYINSAKNLPVRSFSFLNKLEELSINGSVSMIPAEAFLDLKNLQKLYIAGIDDLNDNALKGLSNLLELELQGKFFKIPTAVFKFIPKLKTFTFSSTIRDSDKPSTVLIKKTELQSYLKTQRLEIPKTTLTLESDLFSNLVELEELNLQNAKIGKIEPNAFRGLRHLKKLRLDKNHLTSIESLALAGLSSLELLDLDTNKIKEINPKSFSELSKLKELYLNENFITTLCTGCFSKLKMLEKIFIHDNQINKIENNAFGDLNSLKELHLENNQLEQLGAETFLGLTSLTFLELIGNKISTINKNAFENVVSLEKLHLNDNALSTLDVSAFNVLHDLQELSLEGNQIKKIPPNLKLSSLKILNLRNNGIEDLGDVLPETFYSLSKLDLSKNKINKIPFKFFEKFKNIINLNFDENPITIFSKQEVSLKEEVVIHPLSLDLVSTNLSISEDKKDITPMTDCPFSAKDFTYSNETQEIYLIDGEHALLNEENCQQQGTLLVSGPTLLQVEKSNGVQNFYRLNFNGNKYVLDSAEAVYKFCPVDEEGEYCQDHDGYLLSQINKPDAYTEDSEEGH